MLTGGWGQGPAGPRAEYYLLEDGLGLQAAGFVSVHWWVELGPGFSGWRPWGFSV